MDTFMDKFAQRKRAQGMIDANAAADAAKMEKLQRQVNEYELILQEMRKVNLKTAENAGQMNKAIQAGIEKIEAFQADHAAQAEQEKLLSEIRGQMDVLLAEMEKQNELFPMEIKKQQEAFSEESKRQQGAFSGESKKQQEAFSEEMKKQQEMFSGEIKKQQEMFFGEIKKQQETFSGEIKDQQEAFSGEIKSQLEAFLPEIRKQVEGASRQSEDFFHKESVKVYRNVQAAMMEELGKQTETLAELQKESGKKQKAVLPLTIMILLLLLADIAVHLFNFTLF